MIVVEFQAMVPSDSGASVGMVYAATSMLSMTPSMPSLVPIPAMRLTLVGQITLRGVLDCLLDESEGVGVAVVDRRGEVLRLFEGDVRWQRRHVRIGDRLQHRWTVGAEHAIPRRPDIFRSIDADPDQAERLGVAGVREVGETLRGFELG